MLMYFETTILSIYNFLILYGCLYEVLYIYIYSSLHWLKILDPSLVSSPNVQVCSWTNFLFFCLGLTRLLNKSKTKIKVYLVY